MQITEGTVCTVPAWAMLYSFLWCTWVYIGVPGCTLVYLDIAELYTLQFLLEVETMQIRK